MEIRKLIKFGSSSHVLALPHKWLKEHNLNKGDMVYISRNNNNELVISPELKKEIEEIKKTTINIDGKSSRRISREILIAYINGFNIIDIIGKELNIKAKKVKDFIHRLIGLEVLEQTSQKIVAKQLVSTINIKEFSILNKFLMQADRIIQSMFNDTRDIIIDTKQNSRIINYKHIFQRDEDVNRLIFLIFKAVRYMGSKQIETKKLVNFWLLADLIEEIGDAIKRIARLFIKLRLNKQERSDLYNLFNEIKENYVLAFKSVMKEDINMALVQAEEKEKLMCNCNKILRKHKKQEFPLIIEKFKSLIDKIRDLRRIIYLL